MKTNRAKYLLLIVFSLIFLSLSKPNRVNAGPYVTSSTIISTNLLSGQYASSILSFIYNLSAKPAGTTATISFSQNGSSWYNSSGTLNGSDVLTTGSNNTISLTNLNWSGPNFYYKIIFGGDSNSTPVLDVITVNYAGGTSPATDNSTSTTISTDSYFIGIADGENPATRLIDGVDSGTGTTNTGTVTINSGATLVVNSNQTIVAGSFVVGSGSIVIANGGVLKPGASLYAVDTDGDGYPGTTNVLYGYQPSNAPVSGFKRRSAMTTISTIDCDDNTYSLTNNCGAGIGGACSADIDCASGICATDADADNLFSAAIGHSGTCKASAYPYTDTNDSQYCPVGYNPTEICGKCVNGAKAYQTSSEDLFNECTAGTCETGNCNGTSYACQDSGTYQCSTCCTCCDVAHLTSQTCIYGANCDGCACSVSCASAGTYWNADHTCYCAYTATIDSCCSSCNCSCR